jgi:hypothetical protein
MIESISSKLYAATLFSIAELFLKQENYHKSLKYADNL